MTSIGTTGRSLDELDAKKYAAKWSQCQSQIRVWQEGKLCERDRDRGLFLACQRHRYCSVGFVAATYFKATHGKTSHSSDSVLTDWHLKPALTHVAAALLLLFTFMISYH